ncbi:MAG TPA: hypothetical protein VJZ52_01960 [Candidatus Paceibacterota bacterium]|nr:MAG: Transcriptional regulator, PaaX family [Parcubacteria group bacterium GW2011_GWA1_49_11]HXK35786.1 hypothetical protein [Candidatus Paceibacterota bacterium]
MKSKFIAGILDLLEKIPTRRFVPREYDKTWYNLSRRKLVFRDQRNRWQLTKSGEQWAKRARINYFKERHKAWDGNWRVIIFDIPKELHNKRNYFQKRLKSFDFFPLQKSVYVFPYPCEEELAIIGQQYKVTDYIDVLLANNLGFKEEKIRKHYGL